MKADKIEFIKGGTVTSPEGFFAGATKAGIYKKKRLDLGVLFSQSPCVTAGMFTQSKLKSAPVILNQKRLKGGKAQAIIANSGCSNSYTGAQGLADARAMAAMAAEGIGIAPEDVLVASTGVTGQLLPMDKIEAGIAELILSHDGGNELARAIMTTDTKPKEAAVRVNAGGRQFTIGGVAKGSGMIHPNMATMFCFLTTDAAVEPVFLRAALKKSVDASLNMLSVDMDTSPSDSVILMANGTAGGEPIDTDGKYAALFQEALDRICVHFTKLLARDGEGATRLIEATIGGAKNLKEARLAARTIISSPLVKTAVHGGDPNWGRIIAAVARSGADVKESKIDLTIGRVAVLKGGKATSYKESEVSKVFRQEEVTISVNLNLGKASATAWGCDLSEDYVKINSEYMT